MVRSGAAMLRRFDSATGSGVAFADVSTRAQWPGLRLVRELSSGLVEHYEAPPGDAFTIAARVGGGCRIESRSGRGWQRAVYTAGTIGTTAPGKPTLLRWTTTGNVPLDMIHLEIPTAVFDRFLGEELARTDDLHRYDVLAAHDRTVTTMALAVWQAHEAGAGPLYADAATQFLVAHLVTSETRRRSADRPAAARPLAAPVLTRVIDHLHANLGLRLGLDDLAAVANLSRYHFLRAFTAATGVTPHRYLTQARVDLARQLLTGTDKPIGEIARRCGYDSASHFAALFRRDTGLPPSVFRGQ
jgi:AraC family transcriptional regulator